MLICPVRNCRLALVREDKRLICPQGHAFDFARSGYVNLLQPQERRSRQPGDTAAAVAARRRLHERGFTGAHLQAIGDLLDASPDDVALDVGCGDGYYLGELSRKTGFRAHGLDISVPAIDAAAKRYPECQWVVANADRLIPYMDRAFTLLFSVTARVNVPEFRRLLSAKGRLLLAVPSPEDMLELRGTGRDRRPQIIESMSRDFVFIESTRVTSCFELEATAARDVLLSIYRPLRAKPIEATAATFSLDLLLFRLK